MSEAIRWCGVTLTMNAPWLDPDDVTAARARLALTDDDLAVLARVRGMEPVEPLAGLCSDYDAGWVVGWNSALREALNGDDE